MIEAVLSTVGNVSSSYAGKTLGERVAGRFYTPDVIGSDLARWTLDLIEARILRGWGTRSVRACDPFSGDGRLVIALLGEASSRPDAETIAMEESRVQDVEVPRRLKSVLRRRSEMPQTVSGCRYKFGRSHATASDNTFPNATT